MQNSNVVKLDGSTFDEEVPIQAPREDVVIFENSGELDVRAIKTMGISAKDKPDAIGFFGTGLKYAIAVLLRENQEIVIHSGSTTYIFEKKAIDFRGKEFEIITMNGEELPFTTELGKNWEIWQAFRELYCNCKDEDGKIFQGLSSPEAVSGKTIVIVKGDKFQETYDNRRSVILDTPAYLSDKNVSVHIGHAHNLYYRGITVFKVKHTMFTYNILQETELTEDRTIKWFWKPRMAIMNFIVTSIDKEFIRSVLTAPEGSYESELNFLDSTEVTATPSAEFLAVAEELHNRVERGSNQSSGYLAKQYLHKAAGGSTARSVRTLSNVEQAQLDKAIVFSKKMGFEVDVYPIIITDVLGQSTLGLAEEGQIFVNARAFSMGTKTIVQVLIEEYLHLKYLFADESRALQNYLFEKMVDFGAELYQEVL